MRKPGRFKNGKQTDQQSPKNDREKHPFAATSDSSVTGFLSYLALLWLLLLPGGVVCRARRPSPMCLLGCLEAQPVPRLLSAQLSVWLHLGVPGLPPAVTKQPAGKLARAGERHRANCSSHKPDPGSHSHETAMFQERFFSSDKTHEATISEEIDSSFPSGRKLSKLYSRNC